MDEKKKNQTLRIAGMLLLFFAILVVILLLILNNGRETNTSGGDENNIVTALDCTAGNIEGAFFASSTANMIENQVKITFNDDKISKLFYYYEGTYRDYEVAEQDNAVLHAKYNIYMNENGHDPEGLTPTFSTANTKLRINLYVKSREKMNRAMATLFFVSEDDFDDYMEYSRDKVAEYYEKQGFSCEKQN